MSKRILIVEDHEPLRILFRNVLSSIGCTVIESAGCASAIAAIDDYAEFDFILCDVELEDCNALTLIQQLCAMRYATVVISANDTYLAACRKAGVLAFIRKPITAQDLIRVVNNIEDIDRPHAYIARHHNRDSDEPSPTG